MKPIYKIKASTTGKGNVLKIKVYEQKTFLFIKYWSFMCNQDSLEQAKTLMDNLAAINE